MARQVARRCRDESIQECPRTQFVIQDYFRCEVVRDISVAMVYMRVSERIQHNIISFVRKRRGLSLLDRLYINTPFQQAIQDAQLGRRALHFGASIWFSLLSILSRFPYLFTLWRSSSSSKSLLVRFLPFVNREPGKCMLTETGSPSPLRSQHLIASDAPLCIFVQRFS
jgi:hypothetical protein